MGQGRRRRAGHRRSSADPATKRIALCWEARPEYELLPGLNSVLEAFPEGGVFVLPIFWGPEQKTWTVAFGGSFVPYDNEVRSMTMDQSLPASRIANAAAIEAGLAKSHAKQFRAEPFYALPEFYEQLLAGFGGDREKAFAQIMLDSRDETMMLIQACSVINCANVGTTTIEPAAALNKKRLAGGKQPFFTYKVLQLASEGRVGAASAAGGTHASPRMHLRRGHLRRLDSKTIWVRPTMVGASSDAGCTAVGGADRVGGVRYTSGTLTSFSPLRSASPSCGRSSALPSAWLRFPAVAWSWHIVML